MDTIKKSDGFESEKLIVLPDYILNEIVDCDLANGLYMTDIGFFPYALHHFRERPKGCDSHILIYCAGGSGFVEIGDDKPVKLLPQSLFIIPAGVPHRYTAENDNPWSIYWFHFKGTQAFELVQTFGLGANRLELPLESCVIFSTLFDQCYHSLASKPYSLQHHIHISQTVRYLLSTIGSTAIKSQQDAKREHYLERALQYMNENLNASITLASVARCAGLSKPHLIHLFKQTVGYSPIDYFLRMKIQRASQLLDLTDLSLKEISLTIGMEDPYYFSRMFKKIMGHSPTAYRRILKG
jgi:AraC-like DNA-binding protein